MPPRTCIPVVSNDPAIAAILFGLDPELLAERNCYLAGSTAGVARAGGYRPTRNITFLVSNIDGWRLLREQLMSPEQLGAIALAKPRLKQIQPLRAYRHSLRTVVEAQGEEIPFELVLESHIHLDPPAESDRICGVLSLTPLDLATSKLLANSDRWADDSVFSRALLLKRILALQPR